MHSSLPDTPLGKEGAGEGLGGEEAPSSLLGYDPFWGGPQEDPAAKVGGHPPLAAISFIIQVYGEGKNK